MASGLLEAVFTLSYNEQNQGNRTFLLTFLEAQIIEAVLNSMSRADVS